MSFTRYRNDSFANINFYYLEVVVNAGFNFLQVTPLYLSDQWRNVDWNHYLKLFSSLNPEEMRVAQLVGVEERFIMNALMCTVSWKNPTQVSFEFRYTYV